MDSGAVEDEWAIEKKRFKGVVYARKSFRGLKRESDAVSCSVAADGTNDVGKDDSVTGGDCGSRNVNFYKVELPSDELNTVQAQLVSGLDDELSSPKRQRTESTGAQEPLPDASIGAQEPQQDVDIGIHEHSADGNKDAREIQREEPLQDAKMGSQDVQLGENNGPQEPWQDENYGAQELWQDVDICAQVTDISKQETHRTENNDEWETRWDGNKGEQETQQDGAKGDWEPMQEANMVSQDNEQGVNIGSQESGQDADIGAQEPQQDADIGAQDPQQDANIGAQKSWQDADFCAQEPQQYADIGSKEPQPDGNKSDGEALQDANMGSQDDQQGVYIGPQEAQQDKNFDAQELSLDANNLPQGAGTDTKLRTEDLGKEFNTGAQESQLDADVRTEDLQHDVHTAVRIPPQNENRDTQDPLLGDGAVSSVNRIRINFGSRKKQQVQELKGKLESQLDIVRNLLKKIEAKEEEIGSMVSSGALSGQGLNDGSGAGQVHSEVASVGVHRQPRPWDRLRLFVMENSMSVSEVVEREKRTPKANQFYSNSEFLLAKDKLPSAESNKKPKSNGKKQGVGGHMGSKFFKSCCSLLEKLMKHKHGWMFNNPVDVEALNLHDYYDIIKHPMDLGTIKSRLQKNWYNSPNEFAEDVRLTFSNAMTYNPIGHDVHMVAEQLLKIFEDRWVIIESNYNRELRFAMDYEASLFMPIED